MRKKSFGPDLWFFICTKIALVSVIISALMAAKEKTHSMMISKLGMGRDGKICSHCYFQQKAYSSGETWDWWWLQISLYFSTHWNLHKGYHYLFTLLLNCFPSWWITKLQQIYSSSFPNMLLCYIFLNRISNALLFLIWRFLYIKIPQLSIFPF